MPPPHVYKVYKAVDYIIHMPLSEVDFCALPFQQQAILVWEEGTFIATRFEEKEAVRLYHTSGECFAELFYNQQTNRIMESIRRSITPG